MEPSANCLWCGDEATRLCDAAIGGQAITGLNGHWVWNTEKDIFRCDAPMCAKHSKVIGHICGKEPDLIEWCPYCVANEAKFQPMFEHEAETIRRERHAAVRRSRFRQAVSARGSHE